MKRIICMLLALLTVVMALPMTALAADGAENPFIDVAKDQWYTDAVMWCYENGYMSGTSATTFAPSVNMNRAMFVTVLAAVSGVDKDAVEYTGRFDDVPDGQWYTASVEWAAANGIVSGISDTMFGTNDVVTRETLVLMTYKFVETLGVDLNKNVDADILELYGDSSDVHDWARTAMTWAVTKGIVSGTGTVKGQPLLSPLATATRAQVAVIIKAMLGLNLDGDTPVGQLKLNGTDIENYTIIYGDTRSNSGAEIANKLQDIIAKATGVTLTVASDDEVEAVAGANEILIGLTNREQAGFVTVDREGLTNDDYFYEMQGSYLIIASNEINAGTSLGMIRFCHEELGYTYFGNNFEAFTSIKEVDVEDGTYLIDGPFLDLIVNYQYGGWDNFFSPSEVSQNFTLAVHSIPMLCCDGSDYDGGPIDWGHHLIHFMDGDPCLSDPQNIENAIRNVKLAIEKAPEAELVWVTQSDGSSYCKCERCRAIYLVWGRCSTYVSFLNFICEAVAEEYPDVKLVSLAYKYTIIPPKTIDEIDGEKYDAFIEKWGEELGEFTPAKDISAPENAVMMICTDNSCFSHAIDDPNCSTSVSNKNTRFDEYFQTWEKFFSTIYIWDYLNADSYMHTLFPNVYEMWQNYNYYSRHNVTGMYALGITDDYSDFSELRTYLCAILNDDPAMSWSEYSKEVDSFLKTAYGKGWTYVREYIDITEKLSSENCWWIWTNNKWNAILTEEQWDENYDYLRGLLDRAVELAETDREVKECKQLLTQMLYVELQMTYTEYEETRDEADLEEFRALNEAYALHMGEVGFALPDAWGLNSDPDNWR